MSKIPLRLSQRTWLAMVAQVVLRLLDPGKWTDCPWFIEMVGKPGMVVNLGGYLRPWDGSGTFKGVKVICLTDYAKKGMVTVSAGASSNYDAGASMADLASGYFDKSSIILAGLSQVDFSGMERRSLHLTITSGIGPGASLGTSAAVLVGLLRVFCGPDYDSHKLAMAAVDAELNIAGKTTGNQDHIAASFGSSNRPSAAQRIEIANFPEAKVTPITVGPEVRAVINEGGVITFIGSHDSSDEHRKARERIESGQGIARDAFDSMIASAKAAEQSLIEDDAAAFGKALDQTTEAHRLVHPELIGFLAQGIMESAKQSGSIGAMLPGAGGEGGSVFTLFPGRKEADAFVRATDDLQHYEVRLAG